MRTDLRFVKTYSLFINLLDVLLDDDEQIFRIGGDHDLVLVAPDPKEGELVLVVEHAPPTRNRRFVKTYSSPRDLLDVLLDDDQ